jgi:uncharacterized protein involved in outer membrane biogenesis
MTNLRKITIAVAVLFTAAAIGLGSHFKRLADKHREQVQLELRLLLGDSVRFDGLDVRLLWLPGFVVREFRLADDSRFAATPILKARELILGINLRQLFTGRIVIDSITFIGPEMQIISDETGLLNLSMLASRRKELGVMPRRRSSAPGERRQSSVRFAIDELRVDDGRIIYLDRTAKDPAELQLRGIELQVGGFDLEEPTRVRMAAALTEGLGQDLRIEGLLHRAKADQSWYQRGMDLKIQFDSLHAPMVLRAFAGLRERVPREIDVTGPMALRAQAGGSLLQPRLDDITLKIPLFGSADYNAVITGRMEFTEQRTWSDAKLDGQLKIAPLALSRARLLPVLRDHLPEALVTEGSVSLYSRFEGTWNHLRIGALLRAENSEIRYGDWLRKPAKRPAAIKARLSRRNQRLTIHESELTLGAAKTVFSGVVQDIDAPRLYLKLQAEDAPLKLWTPLSNGTVTAKSGRVSWHLAIERAPAGAPANWHIDGQVTIADGEVHGRDIRGKLEQLNTHVTFLGQQARIERASFRLGGAQLALTGIMPNLAEPKLDYQLTAAEIDLDDVPALAISRPLRLQQLTLKGRAQTQNDALSVAGDAAALQGNFDGLAMSDFRSAFSWSAAGLHFKDLTFRAAQGWFRSDGFQTAAAGGISARLRGVSAIKGADLRPLLASFLPLLKDRLDGNISGQAQYDVILGENDTLAQSLEAAGHTTIQRGVINDFNLLSQLLLRGSGSSVSEASKARLPAALLDLAEHNDTRCDTLKCDFTVEEGRICSAKLILSTPDFGVTGAGWFALDRASRWNGLLVLSPRLTREIQRDYRWIRHLLDRRGRLVIPFRIDGTIPNVRIRIENRNLSQVLRGSQPRDKERDGGGGDDRPPKEEKGWLPDTLDRFLNR